MADWEIIETHTETVIMTLPGWVPECVVYVLAGSGDYAHAGEFDGWHLTRTVRLMSTVDRFIHAEWRAILAIVYSVVVMAALLALPHGLRDVHPYNTVQQGQRYAGISVGDCWGGNVGIELIGPEGARFTRDEC